MEAHSLQLPLPGIGLEPLDLLASRSRRLADIVSAMSRRRDVRRFRSRLLLLLLDLRLPLAPNTRRRRNWYVAGAVARMGPEGLRRAWRAHYREEPKTERTFRNHLAALEQSLAIIRSPGDWLWQLRDLNHPERRPRHANTIHVLESEQAAAWWASEGRARLDSEPRARTNPDVWWRLFAGWRKDAAARQLDMVTDAAAILAAATHSESRGAPEPGGVAPAGAERGPEPPGSCPNAKRGSDPSAVLEDLGNVLRRQEGVLELMLALRRSGASLEGRVVWRMAADPKRLAGAAALYAVALVRGDRIRSPSGWIVRAFKHGTPEEMRRALAIVRLQT